MRYSQHDECEDEPGAQVEGDTGAEIGGERIGNTSSGDQECSEGEPETAV